MSCVESSIGHRIPVVPRSRQCTNEEVGWCHPGVFTNLCYGHLGPAPLTHFILQKDLRAAGPGLQGDLDDIPWSCQPEAVFFMVPWDSSRTQGLQS